jgi:hypothetical protein
MQDFINLLRHSYKASPITIKDLALLIRKELNCNKNIAMEIARKVVA